MMSEFPAIAASPKRSRMILRMMTELLNGIIVEFVSVVASFSSMFCNEFKVMFSVKDSILMFSILSSFGSHYFLKILQLQWQMIIVKLKNIMKIFTE